MFVDLQGNLKSVKLIMFIWKLTSIFIREAFKKYIKIVNFFHT